LLTRISVFGVVGLLTIGAFAIAIPWCSYRDGHVVLSEAAIKGTVTRIGGRIDGRIKSIEVFPGQRVSQGEVLLRLEDRHLQAALDRARAELQSATKELQSEKMGIEQTRRRLTLEIDRLNGTRKKAAGELEAQKSNLVRLQKQYERTVSLTKTGAAAASEMDRITGDRDRAQALVDAATGVLEAADSNLEKAANELEGLRVRESRLSVLDSQIEMARARVAVAEADLEATVIRAPEDGCILERIVEVGGSARVGEPMISLWIGRAWVEAWADERDLRKIKLGAPVDISLDASPRHKLSGRVEAIGSVTDKQLQPTPVPSTLHAFLRPNAMVPIQIALDGDSSQIQLGLSAVVGIQKESAAPAVDARPLLSRLFSWAQKTASTK
jgi:membrane fusion protein (multidrug efflux system)